MWLMPARMADAILRSYENVTRVWVTPPGGSEPTEIEIGEGGTVSSSSAIGARRTASISVDPKIGADRWQLVCTPGAIFDIEYGVHYGGGDYDLIPVFHGEVAQSGRMDLFSGEISLSLVDMWGKLDRCGFRGPRGVGAAIRPNVCTAAVTGVIPDVEVVNSATPGPVMPPGVGFFDSRTEIIRQMCTDGAFEAFFDQSGRWIQRDLPILMPNTPTWTYRTGDGGNLLSASRERPFDRMHSEVVVRPGSDEQTWTQVVVKIEDTSHPFHESKIGQCPLVITSQTIETQGEAEAAANAELQKLMAVVEQVNLTVVANPAQEVGDSITALHLPTDVDPGFAESHLVDSFTLRLDAGTMDIASRTSTLVDTEAA